MSASKDYVPSTDSGLLSWITYFLKNLAPLCEELHIPPATYELLRADFETFKATMSIANNSSTRTSPAIQNKNRAKKALIQTVRQLVRQYLAHNPTLTGDKRCRLGLPIHKKTRTPAPIATDAPHCHITLHKPCEVTIRYYDRRHRKAKPKGQHGVEIRYAILPTRPTCLTQLIRGTLCTRTPTILKFSEEDRGKTLYLVMCWENTRGKRGPWSAIYDSIIP
jgi:hypothetical protein